MAMRDLGVSCHSYSLFDWRNQCLMLGDMDKKRRGAATMWLLLQSPAEPNGAVGAQPTTPSPGEGAF